MSVGRIWRFARALLALSAKVGDPAMTAGRERLRAWLAIDPEEGILAGRLSGALYLAGGLTLWSLLLLPDVSHAHPAWIIGISAGALLWGLCSLVLIDWSALGSWLIHGSNLAGFVLIGGAIASSGGAQSPAWVYLFFIVVFASYFYRPAVVGVYLAGCMATLVLPFLYDGRWSQGAFLSRVVVGGTAFLVLSLTIVSGRQVMRRARARAELLASEEGALRRVATAVIQGQEPEAIFQLVAREAADLLRAERASVLRFDSGSQATVLGSWPDPQGARPGSGTSVTIDPAGDIARVRSTGLLARIDGLGADLSQIGYRAGVLAPVRVAGRVWGAVAVGTEEERRLPAGHEQQLTMFGELLASAVASIDDRAALSAQASTDPLTALANRRALHDRLAGEVARSQRHGRILSVALLDIDHFKQVNDFGGHEAGDEMLVQVARGLAEQARAEDILGRIGGDEFAWVMPETTREQALVAIERARRMIALSASQPHITLSAGICDTRVTSHPAQLVSYADTALYWSKIHGRNRAWIYDPQVNQALAPTGPLDSAERSQARLGLRALSRSIDAKGPSTGGHSERVAAVAAKLAHVAGWGPERGVLLREAALVHDVGKVGLPERVLIKPDRLSEEERALVAEHVELAVRMVEGVLAPEQVDWIRSHHERPDGKGYPHGLTESEIPDGAALLAVADAWEAMRTGRPYRPAKSPDAALAECARLVDMQFTRVAVGALMKLHATGELDDEWDRLLSEPSQPSG